MKTINTRFGEVEYDPSHVIHFPEGLIGLDHLKNFLVMPNQKKGPLFWIQSVDDPAFAFVVTDPTNFFLDYMVIPDSEERRKLEMQNDSPCFVLAIVTVAANKEITLNLQGPILYAPESRKGLQVILEDPRYDIRTPLPSVKK
nr:flagellar assembly protein FliW [uncultured Desulfobulbus sp.]